MSIDYTTTNIKAKAIVLASMKNIEHRYYYNDSQSNYIGHTLNFTKKHYNDGAQSITYFHRQTGCWWKETDLHFVDGPVARISKADLVSGSIVTFKDGQDHVFIPNPTGDGEGMFVCGYGYTDVSDYNGDLTIKDDSDILGLSIASIKNDPCNWQADVRKLIFHAERSK